MLFIRSVINLLLIPMCVEIFVYRCHKWQYDKKMLFLCRYGITSALLIPITRIVTLIIRIAIDFNIEADSSYYTVCALIGSIIYIYIYDLTFNRDINSPERNKIHYKRNISMMFPVALFFSFTCFFYGPIGLYLSNFEEFQFAFCDVIKAILPISLLALLVFMMGILFPDRFFGVWRNICFGIGVASYIQGNWINIRYGSGVLDGSDINWSAYHKYAVFNTIIWILCMGTPFVLRFLCKKNGFGNRAISAIAIFFTFIQLPAMLFDFVTYNNQVIDDNKIILTLEGEYELSNKDNIIFIILDEMDEEYYQEYLAVNPSYVEVLDGFVHYGNAASAAARTTLAVPAMLTGIPYKMDGTYSEYKHNVYSQENVLSAMHKSGYDVRCFLYTDYLSGEAVKYIDNMDYLFDGVNHIELAKKIYKLDAFRFYPHLLKKYVYIDTSEFKEVISIKNSYYEDDALFYKNLNDSKLSISNREKVFRYYHLFGEHKPYTLDANAQRNNGGTSRLEQVTGSFKIVQEFLMQMKDLGIYDEATIIIASDHGDLNLAEHPMFLYKEANSSGRYCESQVPVSEFDISVVLYKLLGKEMPNNTYGKDFRTLDEEELRERHFFVNSTNNISRPSVEEYVTEKDIYDKAAIVFKKSYDKESQIDTYCFGEVMPLNMEQGYDYITEGLWTVDPTIVLIGGPLARFEIPVNQTYKEGTMHVAINGIAYSGVFGNRRVVATINGIKAFDDCIYSDEHDYWGIAFDVAAKDVFTNNNTITIELLFPEISNEEMNYPNHQRSITMGLESFCISVE